MLRAQSTRCAIVAAAAWLVLPAAPATAGDVQVRVGGTAAVGTLPSPSSNSWTGAGLGVGGKAGASGNAGLDLNPADDQASSRNFQGSPLTIPDGLDRLSIRGGDSKGSVSVIYKFVKTKF